MSYRSLKRVLGETSLERKCRFLFGACLLSLITGSFWWYSSQTDRLVLGANKEAGRGLVHAALLRDHWSKLDTTTLRDLAEDLGRELVNRNYSWSYLLPDSQEDGRPQDSFEVRALEQFPRSIAENPQADLTLELDRRLVNRNGQAEYNYYRPIYATNSCVVSCHRPHEVGELIAVAKVVLPDVNIQKSLNENRAILIALAIITTFLAMIASYIIVRYVIVKPLKHLRDVSDEISHGNIAQRADIHTGDEFEELGLAFNRMVRHLTTIQDELRQVNGQYVLKVDELAQANMQLYEMNRLKSDFLATMSHELRTPLNAIIGFSDVLDSVASLDDKQKRYVHNIQKSGKSLLEMINDILDLAKIESGKMEIRLSDFRIEQLIAAQCDMFRTQTERKNIDLDTDVERGLPEMFQDQIKVRQILDNLLSNAIKFTPEGGRIVISASRDSGGELVLKVADTGVGIGEEDQVAIFEKFRQGKSALSGGDAMTREHSGTGLGLSIVRELCKLLGGEISLESELGKGSTFTVRLPWTRADQPKIDMTMPTNLEEYARSRRGEYIRERDETTSSAPVAN